MMTSKHLKEHSSSRIYHRTSAQFCSATIQQRWRIWQQQQISLEGPTYKSSTYNICYKCSSVQRTRCSNLYIYISTSCSSSNHRKTAFSQRPARKKQPFSKNGNGSTNTAATICFYHPKFGQMLAIVNQALNSHLSYQTTVQMCIQQEM